MKTCLALVVTAGAAFCAGLLVSGTPVFVQGQPPAVSMAAVPGQKGGIDVMGPYDVVTTWPKPLSNLPGHMGWTWGAVQGVFAESPDRVFILQRGELPDLRRPQPKPVPGFPSLSFPTGQVPFRNASQGLNASPPGAGAPGADPDDPAQAWQGKLGVDARWEHLMVAFNSAGDIVEQFPQWDSLLKRPHAIYINPWDAEKHLWVVDDHSHAIFKMTHDGKTIVQTLGTPGKVGADASHFNRPTFLAFLPDGTLFVADGYNGNRVVKFDKDGKFVMAWGEKGAQGGNETRPGYFTTVHGIAADPVTHRVYVSDRSNKRMQVFDENGKFLDQWKFAPNSNTQFLMIPADRSLWAIEDTTAKMVKYDLEGHYLYSWGTLNDFPGSFLNPHGFSVDQEQNLYVAEVGNGRVQKFKPRPGANPSMIIGKPLYAAWR